MSGAKWRQDREYRGRQWNTFGSESNMCRNKRPFPSKGIADGVIRTMLQRGANGDFLNAYKCPHCGKWHIGNSNRRSERPSLLELQLAAVLRHVIES